MTGIPSFDLVSRPWLPVQRDDGTAAELSLQEVFAQAGSLRRLLGDVPTQEFALLRLLLAILHDAVDGPEDIDDWADLWSADEPFADVPDYLDRHRDRFDLLHPETPFFQVAGLRTAKDDVASLNRIVADVPNGGAFFTMRMPDVGRLTFAEAARWLVHAHAFDTSGIKSGAVGDPRVKGGKCYPQGVAWAGNLGGVFAEGRDLRETLLLNLVAADNGITKADTDDRPAWRRPPCGPAETPASERPVRPSGPRDLYTWQSRRLRLHHDADGVYGVVLAYGDRLAPQNTQHIEPMTGWRRSKAQEKKLGRQPVYMPREHDPARAAWRGLDSLLSARQPAGAGARGEPPSAIRPAIVEWLARLSTEGAIPPRGLLRVRTVGAVYGTQQSVIDEMVDDGVAMAVVVLHQHDVRYGQAAVDAVADADAAVTALGGLAADLARAAGAEPEPARETARDLGFGELDREYRQWLEHLGTGDDPYRARHQWQETAHRTVSRLGRALLDAAGPAAWEGRIIETPGGDRWLDDTLADWWFRSRLNRALPHATASRRGASDTSTPSEART